MKLEKSERGFEVLMHNTYPAKFCIAAVGEVSRIVSQSSAIGDYENSFSDPGSSFLWIGENHHLNREEVAKLVNHLQAWLETGSLKIKRKKNGSRN